MDSLAQSFEGSASQHESGFCLYVVLVTSAYAQRANSSCCESRMRSQPI